MLAQQVSKQVFFSSGNLIPYFRCFFNFSVRKCAALLTHVFCVKERNQWHGALTTFLRQADW